MTEIKPEEKQTIAAEEKPQAEADVNTSAESTEISEPKEPEKNEKIDAFNIGDTVSVNVRIIEGNKERLQAFEGVVIAMKNKGAGRSFTVRKVSYGIGVERVFPFASPRVESVKRIRRGTIRRAKLYYLRGKSGKKARIKEKVAVGRKIVKKK